MPEKPLLILEIIIVIIICLMGGLYLALKYSPLK
jgi:uncharacterized protein YneF (UPF0154 family)